MDINSTLNLNEQAVPESQSAPTLSNLELKILKFESVNYSSESNKEALIFRKFGFSPERYYSILSSLLANEAATQDFPVLIKRLRRLQSQRIFSRKQLLGR